MIDEILANWSSLLLMIVALAYILIIQNVCKKEARPRKLTEAELLVKLARMGPYNEYEIFRIAARDRKSVV